MHALNHFADSPPRRWAAFIAGDENIFFPALVALVSLEESNPGVFDRYISFDGSRKTSRMDELLARYNVKFIDIHEVNHSERALALAQMHQGQWPVEISMNWALPEHLHLLGYANSIRFDYDTLSIGNFNTAALDRQIFSVVALKIEALTDLPESTIARSREMLGLDPTHVQAFQPGVVVFNNSYAAQFRLFEKYCDLYELLSEECPMHRSSLEQLCFGALAANMEHTRALGPGQNVRVRVTRNVAPGFTSSTAVLHFFTPHKPWRPLSADRLVHILKGGWPMFPFYRMVWLDYASRIEGFEEFCDERPYSSVEIMSVANAVLLTNRRALGEVKLG